MQQHFPTTDKMSRHKTKMIHIFDDNMIMNEENSQEIELLYICGKCGHGILKTDKTCPHCGAKLGKIKCMSCGYQGADTDFKNDICPKCGKRNTIGLSDYVSKGKKSKPSVISRSESADSHHSAGSYRLGCIIMAAVAAGSIFFFLKYFKII